MENRNRASASVRAVVEYTHHPHDMLPSGGIERMRDGMLGHVARQQSLERARAEVTVRTTVYGDLIELDIVGRIDALFRRGDLFVVEEIKLVPAYDSPPEEALPAHKAQAACYAHLLAKDESLEYVIVRVLYVGKDGAETVAFEETASAAALADRFETLVRPYLQMLEGRARWREIRDASIRNLVFPFPAYREGQRELAIQVYWAIKSKKRLFAQAPTGTGKTAAVLFPAVKSLGEGLTGQIYYLTARTTARRNAEAALSRMRAGGLRLRSLTLAAKEKLCPFRPDEGAWRCDLLSCPRAKGFFDRLPDALEAMREGDDWSVDAITRLSDAFCLCPFEFSLTLCEEADVVICDYNYAFDPTVRIRRIFQSGTNLTLLADEAHNLPERARSMLSGVVDTAALRLARRGAGNRLGRKHGLYAALTGLIRMVELCEEGVSEAPPDGLGSALERCLDEALDTSNRINLAELCGNLFRAVAALERFDEQFAVLVEKVGKATKLTLFCLNPAPHLQEITRRLRGCVFFSATLAPLSAWRDAIGGGEADGLLALPSPFPRENLLVLRQSISTRYRAREATAESVAGAILAMAEARVGNYLACFPSYAYLRMVRERIEEAGALVRLHVQQSGMDEAARTAFLAQFAPEPKETLLGLVVLGGIFGEGVDLPGDLLSGVAVVGVGLPQICPKRELLRAHYQKELGDGFAHAYRYPGMSKVLQAVGRVIRTETDRGVALLIDDRFFEPAYAQLLPLHWDVKPAQSASRVRELALRFWAR